MFQHPTSHIVSWPARALLTFSLSHSLTPLLKTVKLCFITNLVAKQFQSVAPLTERETCLNLGGCAQLSYLGMDIQPLFCGQGRFWPPEPHLFILIKE